MSGLSVNTPKISPHTLISLLDSNAVAKKNTVDEPQNQEVKRYVVVPKDTFLYKVSSEGKSEKVLNFLKNKSEPIKSSYAPAIKEGAVTGTAVGAGVLSSALLQHGLKGGSVNLRHAGIASGVMLTSVAIGVVTKSIGKAYERSDSTKRENGIYEKNLVDESTAKVMGSGVVGAVGGALIAAATKKDIFSVAGLGFVAGMVTSMFVDASVDD